MKQALLLVPLLLFGSLPAQANYYQPGGVKEKVCYKEVYREEYIPGTKRNPGRVRRWTDKKRVPCKGRHGGHHSHPRNEHRTRGPVDDNSCIEGAAIGAIAGGSMGGVLSTEENWIWSIPAGVITGAMVGCQIDGG